SGSNANIHSRDPFAGMPGSSGGQTSDSVDDIHNCNDAQPEIKITAQDGLTCEVGDECEFNILVLGGKYPLSGGTYTASPASTVTVALNGQPVETKNIPESDPNSWNWLKDIGEHVNQ